MVQLSYRTVALALAAIFVTAAMAATSLGIALTGRADASHRFTDIGDSSWVHRSTAWLADNGIADGYDDGTFRERNNIT